jgi:hypothetical protein
MNICLGHFDEKKWETMFETSRRRSWTNASPTMTSYESAATSIGGEALCSDSNYNAWRNGLHHSAPLYEDDSSLVHPYGAMKAVPPPHHCPGVTDPHDCPIPAAPSP